MNPLKIPPGIWRNGTEYQSAGRWFDANLVRWVEGVARPMGGWVKRTHDTFTGTARGVLAWKMNDATRMIAVGTESKLYAIEDDFEITDITPTSFTGGGSSSTSNTGYGGYSFGFGAYGTPRPDTGSIAPPGTWTMDNWGEELLACSTSDGKILLWDGDVANKAAALTNAPTSCTAVLVTAERIVVALGAGGDPRKVQWSDQEANTVWTSAAANRAGSWLLQTQGAIQSGAKLKSGALIWTDVDAHLMSYVGMPYVYGFDPVGGSCGIVGPRAFAVIDGQALWMGYDAFYRFDGGVVRIPCDVQDYVFSDINLDQKNKVYAFTNNVANSEVWWLYPSGSSAEVDRYVAYNRMEGTWSIGRLDRTCGCDRGAYSTPLMVGTDGYLYAHETGHDYGSAAVYMESGPLELGTGDHLMDVLGMVPDERTQGDCSIVFKSRNYPNAAERITKTYSLANPTSIMFQARQTRIRVQQARAADWRWGTPRLIVQDSGNER